MLRKGLKKLFLFFHFFVFGQDSSLFEIVSNTGIDFYNLPEVSQKRSPYNDPYFYGTGGVAVADLNNDGLQDLIFTSGTSGAKIYRNLGNLNFQDVTAKSGAFQKQDIWRYGIAVVDVNADGLLDFYVSTTDTFPNELYINKGNFKFEEQAEKFGIENPANCLHSVFFDFDNDGDLDLYVQNSETLNDTLKNVLREDRFYLNENGKFKDVTFSYFFEWKKEKNTNGLSTLVFDFDNDGYNEIFVGNDFQVSDYYYQIAATNKVRNTVLETFKQLSLYSMGSDAQDINGDGYLDFVVMDMAAEDPVRSKRLMSGMEPQKFWSVVKNGGHYQYMYNALHLNNRNGTFSNINFYAGIAKTDWSWSPLFLDFNNDGKYDLFVSNGIMKDITDNDFKKTKSSFLKLLKVDSHHDLSDERLRQLVNLMPSEPLNNYFFLQTAPYRFEKIFDKVKQKPSFSIGAAYADLDNDGDLDIVTNNLEDSVFIYKNNASEINTNNFVRIFLQNPNSENPFCFGAKIWLITNSGKTYYTQINPVRGYQSSSEIIAHFGLGKEIPQKIIVGWNAETYKEYPVKINSLNKIVFSRKDKTTSPPKEKTKNKFFYDATDKIIPRYIHKENEFDDYEYQVLLPHKMSEFGPALAVGDANGDGKEDFFIGGAKGYPGKIYLQTRNGKFDIMQVPDFENHKEFEDIDAVFFDADNDKDLDLFVVSGGYEQNNEKFYKDRLYFNENGTFRYDSSAIPEVHISGGCVKVADIDNDGDLDLFVGGRQNPKNYPWSTDSYILENIDGKFQVKQTFEKLGMVTCASFADLNQDGFPDLILAGEWMPIKIFLNKNGELNFHKNIKNTEGWWNEIQATDLDNDGDLDFVLGNLGLNHKYHASPEHPFHVYSDDLDNNKKTDIILAYEYHEKQVPVRGRSCSSAQIPEIKQKFPSYASFAQADVFDIYGPPLQKSLHKIATNFASIVLENKGNTEFEMHFLPPEAQFAQINGISFSDVNNDKRKDLVLFGNFYAFEVETPRSDALQGLLLLNKGNFIFQPVSSEESGIFNWKDARKSQTIRINKETCILVPNNNDELKLFCPKNK